MIVHALLLLLCLPLVVAIHELGHFWCARVLRIPLAEFSFGMGPVLRQWQTKETRFTIHLWPIAAHVRPVVVKGGAGSLDQRLIQNCSLWVQILFLAGGAIANLASAYSVLLLRGMGSDRPVEGMANALPQFWQLVGVVGDRFLSLVSWERSSVGLPPMDVLQQIAFLSLSFGLINLLPVPPFDGGRIFVILLRTSGTIKLR
ncbi:MAG TPA: site-2 protease family protein [Stenomitos sp.]